MQKYLRDVLSFVVFLSQNCFVICMNLYLTFSKVNYEISCSNFGHPNSRLCTKFVETWHETKKIDHHPEAETVPKLTVD